jgi:flavin-dependent dehydrogenase
MPDGLEAAGKLGISLPAEASFPFSGIRFISASHTVTAAFPHGAGIGVRRTALHAVLVEAAAQAGVDLRWGTPVTRLLPDGVDTAAGSIRARWIVGADGGRSRIRREAGLDAASRDTRRFGFRRHYRVAPWTDRMEIYWGPGCQAYVTPVSPEEVCVALISRDPRLRLDEALPRIPQIGARLAGAEASTTERGAVTATRRLRNVCRGRIALIGDASGSVDAITGEGLCLAFLQALALAAALERDDLARYAAAHRRLMRRPAFMADFMLTMDRWPALERRAMRVLSHRPRIFGRMLAMHVGELPVASFAIAGAALGWGMLAGGFE